MFDSMGYSETVLVVDDEECVLKFTQVVLVRQGYTVLGAGSPAEALKIAQSYAGKIDLLLTDMRMPIMDGMILSAKIRTLHPNLNVVYMTASSPADVALRLPNEIVLSKPFSAKYLCEKIRDSLFQCA